MTEQQLTALTQRAQPHFNRQLLIQTTINRQPVSFTFANIHSVAIIEGRRQPNYTAHAVMRRLNGRQIKLLSLKDVIEHFERNP